MSAELIFGSQSPFETRIQFDKGDKESCIVEMQGNYEDVKSEDAESHVPSGYTYETKSVSSMEDGMGKLTIRGIKYNDASTFGALRTTFRVDMLEVQYDLEDHPHLQAARYTILKWLATDASKRVDGNTYKYEDKNETLETITDQLAIAFCTAYMAGIKTFNRYYPVIEKISLYSNPPGMSRNKKSFTGGQPTFSSNVGRFDDPPLTLSGFPATNFFKSKDSWVQGTNRAWTRTEQWTYTPEGSNGTNSWIYNNL